MQNDGWSPYLGGGCPLDALCQFRQGEDGVPFVSYARDFPPEMNVANLYWRLTGIGRVYMETHISNPQRYSPNRSSWISLMGSSVVLGALLGIGGDLESQLGNMIMAGLEAYHGSDRIN